MSEEPKRVDYEMKYIGWNMGQYGRERHETMGDIEILELKIDGVDVLKQLEAVKNLKNELDEKIDHIDRASKTHGIFPTLRAKHRLQKCISQKLGEILEAVG